MMGKQMDGQTNGWIDRHKKCCDKISFILHHEQTERQIDGWADEQKDRWMSE